MRYAVEAFDKKTELLVYTRDIPRGSERQLVKIMNWLAPQEGWEGYSLTADQIAEIASIIGEELDIFLYDFQLSVNID